MKAFTPTDGFNRPSMLGNWNGAAVPLKVLKDGTVCAGCRYELVETLNLDFSAGRVKERFDIAFDCFAVAGLSGSFSLFIGSDDEDKRCIIDKCLSADASADSIFISNEPQQGGFAYLWFFRIKEDL